MKVVHEPRVMRFPFLSLSGSAAISIILILEEKYPKETPHTAVPPHTHLLTSCPVPGWVRVKDPPSQDDPFPGGCCCCPSPDPGPQQVGEWPQKEPCQTAAEEVKRA